VSSTAPRSNGWGSTAPPSARRAARVEPRRVGATDEEGHGAEGGIAPEVGDHGPVGIRPRVLSGEAYFLVASWVAWDLAASPACWVAWVA